MGLKIELKKYYAAIKRELPCGFHVKYLYMKELKHSINEYIIENQIKNIDDIKDQFGSAQEIARGFADNDIKRLKRKSSIQLAIIIILCILLIISGYIIYEIVTGSSSHIDVTING